MEHSARIKNKYTYGILEKQFSNLFKKALRQKGITGEILLQFCEMRLDNVVFRLGISPTRRGARQFVSHKHILVNNNVCNIPSFSLKIGDIVSVREKSKSISAISNSLLLERNKVEWGSFINGLIVHWDRRRQVSHTSSIFFFNCLLLC